MENLTASNDFNEEFDGVVAFYVDKGERLVKRGMSPAMACVVLLCATVHISLFAEEDNE